jgi:hypothetical protein
MTESDEEYWHKEFDRARDLVDAFVADAIDNKEVDPEALSMWLIEANIERDLDGDGKHVCRRLVAEVKEFFRDGPLPRPDDRADERNPPG